MGVPILKDNRKGSVGVIQCSSGSSNMAVALSLPKQGLVTRRRAQGDIDADFD